jgi:hypothetical protein
MACLIDTQNSIFFRSINVLKTELQVAVRKYSGSLNKENWEPQAQAIFIINN